MSDTEPSCPKCGESPMFRSQVHGCCVALASVRTLIHPATAMATSLYGERWFRETDILAALAGGTP